MIVRVLGDETGQYVPERLFTTDNRDYPILAVAAAAPHKDGMLVHFERITDRTQAEELRGTSLFIDVSQRRVLDDDEFWPDQLLGLDVLTPDGERLGVISGSISGAQDRLVVATDDGEKEVPFVAAIVTVVDIDGGFVVVDAPDGLF